MTIPKDQVLENTHPLNLADDGTAPDVSRIPLYEVYMRMAEELAKRSTCARLQVGTVVTDVRLENVVAIGYMRIRDGSWIRLWNRCPGKRVLWPGPGKCWGGARVNLPS